MNARNKTFEPPDLSQAETHLAIAQKLAHLGSWDLDVAANLISWSDEMYRIFGLEKAGNRLTYDRFKELVHPDDRERVTKQVEDALQGNPYRIDYRIIRPDGTERMVMANGETMYDSLGQPTHLIGALQDITDRLAEQKRRREAEALFQLISENSQDIITYTTAEGINRYVSPSVKTLLGYEVEEVIGKPWTAYYHPDDLQKIQERAFADEDVVATRVQHKNGEWLWFETAVKIIRDNTGAVKKIFGIGRNITDRVRAEEEVRVAREQLDAYIKDNVDAIAIVDRSGRVLQMNKAFEELLGWSFEEIQPFTLRDLPNIPECRKEETEKIIERVLKGESVTGIETKRLTKDGRQLDVLISFLPTRSTDGSIIGWSGTVRDITEQKKAEHLVLQAEKLAIAGQLAAGIAHEIRNPLTALKGFTQLMRHSSGSNEDYLNIMDSELIRIENILSELLVLAKPQAEKFVKNDLAEIVREVVALIESQAILHNIEIQCEIEPDLPQLACDQNQLKQIFINFLKNAIEAMPKGGRVRIEVGRHGDGELLLRFLDEGVGIPEEFVHRLGEPFYTTKEKGTGLGLMVSKKIVENHRGRLEIASTLGEGTTIHVYLPWK